jgi:hypothetical protein
MRMRAVGAREVTVGEKLQGLRYTRILDQNHGLREGRGRV